MKNVGSLSSPHDQSLTDIKIEIPTCEICIEPMQSPNHKVTNPNPRCDHPFCSDCIIKYIQAKLDDNVAEIACPAINCDRFLDPLTCQNLVGNRNFVRWCDVLCESVVMKFERSYCPNRDCSALIIDECSTGRGRGRKPMTKSKCPGCKQLFCFKCSGPWHAGFSCMEAEQSMGDANLRALGVLAERRKWQKCPRCRNFVERIDGCRAMRCRCGVFFCYNCGADMGVRLFCNCHRSPFRYVVCSIILIVMAIVVGMICYSVRLMVKLTSHTRS